MKGNLLASRPLNTAVPSYRARLIVLCCGIFLLAAIVRIFHWQDNPIPPFHGMTGEYKAHAMLLVQGDLKTFLRGPNPPSNAHVIKHPPGYPLLMAAVYKLFGDHNGALRMLHILLDSLCAVIVFLLAYELFSVVVAAVSGFLVALSPQLAYHSVALLPDPLTALPLLLSAWLLVRAYKNPRWLTIFASGLVIGVSCLFRSNVLLLPLFVCALMPVLFERGRRLRFATWFLLGFLVLVIPVTIRNAIYFRSFIPVSLSAGITLVEGIGVYDKEKRFGLPDNDYLVSKWEAQWFGRPDYLGDRFGVDGVMRERFRIKRGLEVVTAHPFWFLKVMAHRAISMLRLARVELVKPQPAVRNSLSIRENALPVWTLEPSTVQSPPASEKLKMQASGDYALRIEGAGPELFVSDPIKVFSNTEYLITIPIKIERGSVVVEVIDEKRKKVLSSTPILHPINWLDLTEKDQPEQLVKLPFANVDATDVIIKLKNQRPSEAVAIEVGSIKGFALGAASQTWTRYPRIVIRLLQRLFITAIMLPFTLLGITILIRKRCWRELAILLVVPIYYMCVQSALWTEFRYILSMHYFLFILAAVGSVWTAKVFSKMISKLRKT